MTAKHLPPLEPCGRNHNRKHCFHVTQKRRTDYTLLYIAMECCHCKRTVIAQPTVFTITTRN